MTVWTPHSPNRQNVPRESALQILKAKRPITPTNKINKYKRRKNAEKSGHSVGQTFLFVDGGRRLECSV